jgi:transcriptional regulator with XRE-family HTH domain
MNDAVSREVDLAKMLMEVEFRSEDALREYRKKHDLTHYSFKDAATRADVDVRQIYRARKSSNPTIRSLASLAGILDVDLRWLLFGEQTTEERE